MELKQKAKDFLRDNEAPEWAMFIAVSKSGDFPTEFCLHDLARDEYAQKLDSTISYIKEAWQFFPIAELTEQSEAAKTVQTVRQIAKDLLPNGTPEIFWPAIRQYRHNNSDGFVMGYDPEVINELFASLPWPEKPVFSDELIAACAELSKDKYRHAEQHDVINTAMAQYQEMKK